MSDFVSTADVLLTKPQLIWIYFKEIAGGLNRRLRKKPILKISGKLEAIFRDFYWFGESGKSGKKKRQETFW